MNHCCKPGLYRMFNDFPLWGTPMEAYYGKQMNVVGCTESPSLVVLLTQTMIHNTTFCLLVTKDCVGWIIDSEFSGYTERITRVRSHA